LPQVLFIIEILSVLLTLIYLYFAAKKNASAWIFGVVASILGAYMFFEQHLPGSAVLNIVYGVQGIIGYINWKKFISDKQPAYDLKWTSHIFWILSCIMLSLLVFKGLMMLDYHDFLYADILLAMGSIVATSLEIRKDTSCWWYWMVCNIAYATLYLWQSLQTGQTLYLYALLMLGLAIFSYAAKRAWEKVKTI